MSLLDIFLGALLAFAFYKGWKNGLFVELASLVSFFVGIFAAIKFSYLVETLLHGFLSWSPKTVKVVAFVLTLMVVIVAIHFLAKVFTKMASFAFLGWLNTLGGAVFGTLKTVLLLGVLLSLVQKVNINDMLISKEKQKESIFFNPILKTSETLLPFLTTWFRDLKAVVK
jgi:membrane protein required for colicin V production